MFTVYIFKKIVFFEN